MFNIRQIQNSFMIIYCIFYLLNAYKAEVIETTQTVEIENNVTTTEIIETKPNDDSTNVTLPDMLPKPLKLIGYRYDHPITIYKHKGRLIRQKPRRRIKKSKPKPKPVYGPPPPVLQNNINYNKHLTRNKIYDFDEFKQEFGTDLHIQTVPISTYEKKHIEVDFYENAHKPGGDRKKKNEYHFSDTMTHSRPHTRSEEEFSQSESSEDYAFSSNEDEEYLHEQPIETPYEYPQPKHPKISNEYNSAHRLPSHNSNQHIEEYRPQSQQPPSYDNNYYSSTNTGDYELPSTSVHNFKQESSFNSASNNYRPQTQHTAANGHSSHTLTNSYIRPPSQINANDYNRPSHSPPNNFGKPPHLPNYQTQNQQHPPPNKHFAEPPVHITYSPSIEINPLPPTTNFEGPFKQPTQHAPSSSYPPQHHGDYSNNQGNFAEPPPDYYSSHEGNLPLNNQQPHGYDYPKSSYEVPLYEATPFGKNEHQEQYPPVSQYTHLETEPFNAQSKQQNNVQNVQIKPKTNNDNNDLNIAMQNKGSSNKIEVTLKRYPYSQRNKTNIVLAPPRKVEQELINQLNNLHSLSTSLDNNSKPPVDYFEEYLSTTSTHTPLPRKRKRTRIPTNTKHNLDVDELRIAFEANSKRDSTSINIPDPSSSESKISETSEPSNFVLLSSTNKNIPDFSGSLPWEPVKIKSTFTHNKNYNQYYNNNNDNDKENHDIITALGSNKNQRIHRIAANNSNNNFDNVEVISIEKSRSHSYYAGTMSPSEIHNDGLFKYSGISSRNDKNNDEILLVSTGIQVSNGYEKNDENIFSKGQVFDEPKQVKVKKQIETLWNEENLPKNHKLF